jgi:hypothetical protein
MSISIKKIGDECEFFFSKSNDRRFLKTWRIADWGERDGILPALKWYLAGCFGNAVYPEENVSKDNLSRVDFLIGDVAVEVAVRTSKSKKYPLSNSANASEIKKLVKYNGPSLLILFDYSKAPFVESEIENFRDWPSLGKGNHNRSPFSVIYYYLDETNAVQNFRKNIRV